MGTYFSPSLFSFVIFPSPLGSSISSLCWTSRAVILRQCEISNQQTITNKQINKQKKEKYLPVELRVGYGIYPVHLDAPSFL